MKMDKTNNSSRMKFTIDKTGFFAEGAMILLVFAALFQVIGRWGMWYDRIDLIMMLALPVVSCLLLALCVLLFGKKVFFLSSIPVLLGVVFFIFKLFSSTSWLHTVVCILLYICIVIIYPATVFGWIRTKWLLPPLFGLPLLYHIFYKDLPRLSDTVNPVTFSSGMQEMSILCMMAALMFIGFGLKKREPEPTVIEPEVVEPEPVPEPVPEPAPAEKPAPVAEPVPAAESAPTAEPVVPGEPAPVEEPAPAVAESDAYFDAEAAFEPAPEGSIPELTLDPDPIDFGPEADGQESGNEQ